MKKYLPYILGLFLIILLIFIVLKNNETAGKKEISTFVSLRKEDKNPYGTYVAYNGLKRFFPNARFLTGTRGITDDTTLSQEAGNQLFISFVPQSTFYEYELDELMEFIDKGNNVFISCFQLGKEFERFIDARTSTRSLRSYPFADYGPDTMHLELDSIPLPKAYAASYPGVALEGYFVRTGRSTTRILGRGYEGRANFIQLKKGKGSLLIHLSPLSFSNYFLLYGNNMEYFNQVFSLIPAGTRTVIWDEYYRKRRSGNDDNKGWFGAIMKQKAFRSGILLALLLLLIFTLLEMRRRQRFIPHIEPPKNDTLDFVKTMGLLYYEKKDNTNLAHKMSAYFLEHLRSKYHIFSKELDAAFIKEVSDKSGADATLVSTIVYQIKQVYNEGVIADTDLIHLQTNIEKFYNSI
ncbi:hypothetical protein [Niabella drilacis]|uniref:DUF4350 domain-containing protein n=1 Tax=Niabella drilacis (strain DSM 25811 / CCM 8410 / CCUG 62505 / LMG 26954 / E90) TaxID=1285928 RepID=A0A1G6VTU7_NIADE|nr:hypothetical protein [Niabella drilacis]SDD56954.1 hypothetical protein SAMN04487894_110148 [Niabella drilacis]